MVGLDILHYLGHEGKKISGGKSKSNLFKIYQIMYYRFLSDGFSLPVWLTRKVFFLSLYCTL